MGMSQSHGPNPGDPNATIKVLRDAVDLGVTFSDTAEAYGHYVNEVLVGEAIAPVRDQVVLVTKFGWRIENGQSTGLDSRPTGQASGVSAVHRELLGWRARAAASRSAPGEVAEAGAPGPGCSGSRIKAPAAASAFSEAR